MSDVNDGAGTGLIIVCVHKTTGVDSHPSFTVTQYVVVVLLGLVEIELPVSPMSTPFAVQEYS